MKRLTDKVLSAEDAELALHDYHLALQSAVSWLGDRYLLAEPVQRRNEPAQPYFTEPRRWYPITRH